MTVFLVEGPPANLTPFGRAPCPTRPFSVYELVKLSVSELSHFLKSAKFALKNKVKNDLFYPFFSLFRGYRYITLLRPRRGHNTHFLSSLQPYLGSAKTPFLRVILCPISTRLKSPILAHFKLFWALFWGVCQSLKMADITVATPPI
jgi:hypothetical protein